MRLLTRSITKTLSWSVLLAIGLTLGLARLAGAQSANDPALALAAFEKVAFGSTQDIEAALNLLSEDAVVTVKPAPPGTSGVWTGKADIRGWLQLNKQQNVKRETVGSPQVEGSKVTSSIILTNKIYDSLGVGAFKFTTEVVVENGKIKSFLSMMTQAELARFAAAQQKAAQPAAPVAAPNTGQGQSSPVVAATNFDLSFILTALLVAGLLSLLTLFVVRRNIHRTH